MVVLVGPGEPDGVTVWTTVTEGLVSAGGGGVRAPGIVWAQALPARAVTNRAGGRPWRRRDMRLISDPILA
jgi:hypothetical protein